MSFGIDYSFGSGLTAAQMKAAGVTFVARYLDYLPNGKVISKAEAENLLGAGLDVVLVFESTAERMLGGHGAGAADAAEADKQVKALGMAGVPVYFACDFNATPAQQAAINAYLDGVASVIGLKRTGIYGGYWPCMRAWKAGKASYVWQTYAWSGSNVPGDPADLGGVTRHLFQYSNGHKLGPADVDYDKSREADFGQWPRPKAAPSGPVRHQAGPAEPISLYREAQLKKTSLAFITALSEPLLNPANLAVFKAYLALDAALTSAGHAHPVMPDGLVYYTKG